MVWTQQQAPVAKRSVSDFTPPFLKLAPGKGITKRSSQQGSQRGGGGGGDQGPGEDPAAAASRDSPAALVDAAHRTRRGPQRLEAQARRQIERRGPRRGQDPGKPLVDFSSIFHLFSLPSRCCLVKEMLKQVRGILNKLTPSKFDKLLAKIQAMNIDTEERMDGVIKLFFEKVSVAQQWSVSRGS